MSPTNAPYCAWGVPVVASFVGLVTGWEDLTVFESTCFKPPIRGAAITAISTCSFLGVNFSSSVAEVVEQRAKHSEKALQVPVSKRPVLENAFTNILCNQTS